MAEENRDGADVLVRLEPLEPFRQTDGRFVVRETAQWTTTVSDPKDTYCVFTVEAGLVASIARYDDRAEIPPA